MNPLQNNYPFFEANQVLTNEHLNTAIVYLDEQTRLSRTNLIGSGIVCGFEISLNAAKDTLTVSKGCGISSEGYLIVAEPIELKKYRNYPKPDKLYDPSADDPLVNLWKLNDPAKKLYELVPQDDQDIATATNLDGVFLTNKVVLVYLELIKDPLRNCSANNCDDKGALVTASLRYLLVNKSALPDPMPTNLPEVPLPRAAFTKDEDLRDYEKTYRDFFAKQTNGKTALQRLTDAIKQAEQTLKVYLPDLVPINYDKLTTYFALPGTALTAIQYYYDFLRDLTAGYHELLTAPMCLPNSDLFPRHLALGLALNPGQAYRQGFISSPAVAMPQQLTRLGFLFNRLAKMVDFFQVQTNVALKITPSQFGIKHLSGKALPFYYQAQLRPYWDSRRKNQVLSWHDDANNPDYVRNPLQYDLEPYNFFRVEGHVGQNILDLRSNLAETVRSNRLPITILYLDADATNNFLDQHPAIEHQAGVIPGSTFVVLYRGAGTGANLVLADFSLPYRIETVSKSCIGRLQVKECEFEWFDSRQHLANLAKRAYRYPPRKFDNETQAAELERAALAEFYVIVVYRYDIQGQSLLENGQVQVKIPIADLINGQLTAIARKLNEQFPSGVLFDYKRASNKLVIRYFEGQTFRIEWGGLQGNQIRYAYTPEGIIRWYRQIWQPLYNARYQVVCQLRNEYYAEEYQWLHEDKHYEAKYPGPSAMPTAKELIDWEAMIKTRAKLAIPIQGLLARIVNELDKLDNVVNVVLVGDWANGSWVSRNSKQNNFPVGFMKLREKITGKTGVSDIDLLVDLDPKGPKIDQVMASFGEDLLGRITKEGRYKVNVIAGKPDAQKWRTMRGSVD